MNERIEKVHERQRKSDIPNRDELAEILANGPLSKINRILHKDEKSKLRNGEQSLKLAARRHNFTPLENAVRTKNQAKHGFPSEQHALDKATDEELNKLARGSDIKSKNNYDSREKKRLARRLHSKDKSLQATQLREQAEMPYHKARKVSISINSTETQNESARKKIKALRKILFFNPKEETLETTFMGNIVAHEGQAIKQLTRFITGTSAKDMEVLGHNQTNRDVHRSIDQGLREIPIARISSSSGKVLLEITCSYPRWSAAHPGSLSNLDGSWTDGQINFYHRQKKLEKKQVEQIFNRWLELNKS